MRFPLVAATVSTLLASAATGLAGEDSSEPKSTAKHQPEKVIAPSEKIVLFDGKNLDHFYSYIQDSHYKDPSNVFSVVDGMIRVSGDGYGSLITNKAYRDYHVVVEYRWGDQTWKPRKTRTKDSGLLVHSVGPDGGYGGRWKPSLEVQIIEGGVGDFILVRPNDPEDVDVPFFLTCEVTRGPDGGLYWEKGGKKVTVNRKNRPRINWSEKDPDWKDKLGFRGENDPDSPGHKWTRLDVYCEDDTIRTFVNGVQVNAAIDCSPTYGQIQFQTECAEIFVRRFELYPADGGPKPAPAKPKETNAS